MTYTLERVQKPVEFTEDVKKFLADEMPKLSKRFGDKLNFKNNFPEIFAQQGIFLICKRNEEITGIMVAVLRQSPFDFETTILRQVLFYVKPNSGRTAYHLFKKFIDIGKSQANHIITMITSQTNIKPETLKKMGFKELETLYLLET